MPDPRFYAVQGPYTLAELADASGATVHDGSDPKRILHDVAPIETAEARDISFLDNPRYADAFAQSKAGGCVVHADRVAKAPDGMGLLIADNPYMAYARIARAFYPPPAVPDHRSTDAVIDPTARVGKHGHVAPGAIVGPRAEIGERCTIGANAVVGAGVVLGDDVWIGACVSLAYCIIGSRVRILAGARIGEDGFGFAPDPDTPVNVPQLGRVVIDDDVEIGANTTIDRGAGPDTVIGRGCRIDNLVQIGHNVELGRGCIVIAQAGISGSTRLEDWAIVAAQGGVAGHLRIGKGSRVAAKAGVMRDVPDGDSVGGVPAVPLKQWFRQVATVQRLAQKKGQ